MRSPKEELVFTLEALRDLGPMEFEDAFRLDKENDK